MKEHSIRPMARRRLPRAFGCSILLAASVVSPPAAIARAREQVGDIVSRPAVRSTETALTAIQNSREKVKQRLAAIAAQADPLAGALAAYKNDPNPRTAVELLHREAVVAGIGAGESEKIAVEAETIARTCAELATQCAMQAEMSRPIERARPARRRNTRRRGALGWANCGRCTAR